MAWPIVISTNGYGTPVTESSEDNAVPYEISTNGYGTPVIFVASGGLPVREGVGVRFVHNLILNVKNLTLNGKNLTLRAR